jgi:cellulose synthase/poly-beta-1,6-N-acetylglucosamine synthase-like glycosyltransferase
MEDAARRRSWPVPIEDGARPNTYRVPWAAEPPPLVSLIICSRDTRLLGRCLDAVRERTDYSPWQAVVVRHLPDDERGMEDVIRKHAATAVEYREAFHFARMCALGASHTTGEILIFLNDDVVPLEPAWLERLVAQAVRPEVGAVGARLLYPSGAIQHAGMAIGIMDGVGHPHRGLAAGRYWGWVDMRREVSAVTGACMAVRRSVFEELGGFDDAFPSNYNDADFCLRARRAGYTILYEPAARLRHDECATRTPGTQWQERQLFHERWAEVIEDGDPFYNPNLARSSEDGGLRGAEEN